jgi:hypothetical protein
MKMPDLPLREANQKFPRRIAARRKVAFASDAQPRRGTAGTLTL